MKIQQFEDKGLSHFSYLIISESDRKGIVIDPARDARQYLDALAPYGAELSAIIETHPHADFVSSHLELHRRTGAPILASGKIGASYPLTAFNDGDTLEFAEFTLQCIDTPGHSPDSISVLLIEGDRPTTFFTGDFLFVGDVGRPDLREKAGAINLSREDLARMMYRSIHDKLLPMDDSIVVYPAHGAGSLCGKALSAAVSTTIGQERISNPSLQPMAEEDFVTMLLADQPFVPKYFPGSVEINRVGAPDIEEALAAIPFLPADAAPEGIIIDTRSGEAFKAGHIPGAFNLQNGGKFETWLGSIMAPGEHFTLVAATEDVARHLIRRAAAIGYERQITGVIVADRIGKANEPVADVDAFRAHPEAYTIVDIRNRGEQAAGLIFSTALCIPLPELRERAKEIPTDKPIMVHCAAGYRSACGQSILAAALPAGTRVYDLGEAIKTFQAVLA